MYLGDNCGMRTTIDIHDELLDRAKRFAASSNKRLADVVNDALQESLGRVEQPSGMQEEYQMATYGRGGVRPGIDLSDNASVQDALDEEARDPNTGRLNLDKLR